MPFILRNPESHVGKAYKNSKGNTECVEFVRQTLNLPATALWIEGTRIQKGSAGIMRGTAIATFVAGKYPQTGDSGKHAAIYLEQNDTGIVVLDQWRAQGMVEPRTIRFDSKSPSISNQGDKFSVIEVNSPAAGTER